MITKELTVRLSAEQYADLAAVARCDGVPMVEEIRASITQLVEAKRQDPEFQTRLNESLHRNRQLLERLSSL